MVWYAYSIANVGFTAYNPAMPPAKSTAKPAESAPLPEKPGPRLRIIGHSIVPAKTLIANPLNFRTHPETQKAAVGEAIDTLGWIDEVLVNQRTGHIINGHLRAQREAERDGDVPVKYVDLSEEEERLALATIDPLASLAIEDSERTRELLDSLVIDPNTVLGVFLESNAADAKLFGLVSDESAASGPSPKRIPGATQNLCVVIPIKNLARAEKAIASTGLINRAEALDMIFKRQLDAVGQFDV